MKYIVLLLLVCLSRVSFADDAQRLSLRNRALDNIKPYIEYRGNDPLELLEGLIYLIETPPSPDDRNIALINTNGPTFHPGDIFDRSLPIFTNQPYMNMNLRNSSFRYILDYITQSLNLHYKVTETQILIFTEDGIPLRKE